MMHKLIIRLLIAIPLALPYPAAIQANEADAPRLFRDLDANHDGKLALDEVPEDQRLLVKRLVRTGDDDHDGQLTEAEFTAALQPTRAEKNLVEKTGSRIPGADALTVLLAKMDVNHDRQVEATEVPAGYKRLFEQMLRPADDDKNGGLDQRELARAAPRLGIMSQVAAARLGVDVSAELKKLSAADRAALEQMDAYGRPGDMMADPAKAEQLFGRLDANGDQKLTLEEAPPMFADRFTEMIERGDRDGDKQLTKKEFLDLSRRLAEFQSAKVDPEAVRRFKRQLLRRFDHNNDGRLTVREAPPRLAQNFDRADANSNGFLDDAELTQAAQTMTRLENAKPRGPFSPKPSNPKKSEKR